MDTGVMLRRLALLLLCWPLAALAAPAVKIGAAADLRLALPALVAAHAAATGTRFAVSYGSSGQMVQQAQSGAPFELLLLADAGTAARLAAAVPGTQRRPYALGRLALVVRASACVRGLSGLNAALATGRIRRLAIANPAHAPYGVAAQAVLARLGATAAAAPRLVLGENVSQALAFVTSGAADAGLVALPLARVAGAGLIVVPVPPDLHAPLVQTLLLMPGASPAAGGLANAITGPQGRAALARAGFGLP
jgi:molybdate transport system substrate-binding protein